MTGSRGNVGAACGGTRRSATPVLVAGLAGLVGAAVLQELRQPEQERTWHGFVAGVVPYDFRPPSLDRLKEAVWDPAGPAVKPRVFGVGWSLNLGRLVADARTLPGRLSDQVI